MSETGKRIVVVGAGQAGLSFVAKARSLDATASITLIGDEPVLPYQRPPLSKKYLSGEMSFDRLLLRDKGWFAEHDIEIRTDERVAAIDRDTKRVEIAGGAALPYDKLVLATGSIPRRLPDAVGGNLENVHVMRSVADAGALAPKMRKDSRLAVVGGGYIGLEVAAIGRSLGLEVTVIEAAPRILQRVACEATSDFYRDLHAENGVRIVEGTMLDRLAGEGDKLKAAVLANGTEIAADIVVAGIGIEPDTSLAVASGLTTANGIWVDEFCTTSDPDIYAAGDCTSFPYRGGRVRLESVPNAIHQAEVAAENVCGNPAEYVATPWFWSDQYDVKLQIAGLSTGYESTIARPGKREGAQSVWYFKGEELLAVDAMNDPATYMAARKIIEARKSVPRDAVADGASNLKDWI